MADLFSRLAERTLGVAEVARPLTPAVFTPLPQPTIDAFASAPSPAIPSTHAPQPEPDAAPRAPKSEQAPDAADLPFAPRRKAPESRGTGDHAYSTTMSEPFRSRVGQVLPPVSPQDSRAPDSAPLEQPAMEHGSSAATESRSPIVALPSRRSSVETSASDPHARSMDPRDRDDDERDKAAISVDAPLWKQPAGPAIPAAPRASARTATQERDRVRSHDQADSTVEVNIGRIEVRAVFPPSPTSSPVRRAADSALSLANYFKERDGGAR